MLGLLMDFGIAMIASGGAGSLHFWFQQHWLHAKLALVLVLTGYVALLQEACTLQNHRNTERPSYGFAGSTKCLPSCCC